MDIIRQRLEEFPGLLDVASFVPHDQLADHLATARQAAVKGRSEERKGTRSFDIADAEPEEVRRLLFSLPINTRSQVLVLWPSYHEGIRIPYGLFVDHYDDLWYPSSDDIWILHDADSMIDISHEEEVTFFPLKGEGT
jgi:hypothetical protein